MSLRTKEDVRTNAETACHIGIKPNTLEIWRTKGKGPKWVKADPESPRSPIRYRVADIEAWMNERTCRSTSQYKQISEALESDAPDLNAAQITASRRKKKRTPVLA